MAISYKRLFKLLIDRDMKKRDLQTLTGLSHATIQKMENGENVMMDVVDKVCTALDCQLSDIAEVVHKE